MSKYKLFGAKIKKEAGHASGGTDNGNTFEKIVKEISTEVSTELINAIPSASVDPINITEGALNPAASSRTVNMNGQDLEFSNANDLTASVTGAISVGTAVSGALSTLTTSGTSVVLTATNSGGSSTGSVYALNNGLAVMYSSNNEYRLGTSSTTLPKIHTSLEIPRALNVTNDGSVTHTYTSAYFVNSSVFTPNITGHPTNTELRNHLVGLSTSAQSSIKNRVIYYNGTTTSTTDYTYAWYFTGDSKLYLLDKPEASVFEQYGSISVTTGNNSLTSSDNGIQSYIYAFNHPLMNNTKKLTNVQFQWYNTSSTGSLDLSLRTHSGTWGGYPQAVTYLNSAGFKNLPDVTLGTSTTAIYISLDNITGNIIAPRLSFTITDV